jgi:hypothetical protein
LWFRNIPSWFRQDRNEHTFHHIPLMANAVPPVQPGWNKQDVGVSPLSLLTRAVINEAPIDAALQVTGANP